MQSWISVQMRPFGHVADLDLDFASSDRPGLVTAVLAQCGGKCDPDFWWSQLVSVRTAALLHLVARTEDTTCLPLTARCTEPACGATYEFELPLHALSAGEADGGPICVQLEGQREVAMRRPTGYDLRRWREARPASRSEAVRAMLDALVLGGRVDAEDEARISESIAMMDPLVAFTVSCHCPACGVAAEVPIDLETLALMRLESRQRALLHEVHRFASCYGWTESEVLAMPRERRARYLELIDRER